MHRALILATAALLSALPLSPTLAQPTFGKPKPNKGTPAAPDPKPRPAANNNNDASPETPNKPALDIESGFREGDPPRKKPAPDAEAGVTYAWKSVDGLKYTWNLPVGYARGEAYDLVVICHPANADFRWGVANHKPGPEDKGGFRQRNMVVSVDGPIVKSDRSDLRTFECTPQGAVGFRNLCLELTRTFPVRRIYIYGHGNGGAFAVYFGGLFPALADGVVSHGGGAPAESARKGDAPIVFLHGAKDPIVPVAVSIDSHAAFKDKGHTGARLRLLTGFNDFPNPVRVSECLDYCNAMRTDDAADLLASVESILRRKPADEYEYRSPVWYAGAYEALGRLFGKGVYPVEEVPDDAKSKAQALIDRIDAEGAKHVAALAPFFPATAAAGSFPLDGQPWIGHLVLMREDFRGVPSVESFITRIGYDAASAAHNQAAKDFAERWENAEGGTEDKARFELACDSIEPCFLSPLLPLDMLVRTRMWQKKASDLGLTADALEKFENIQHYEKGWKEGQDAYAKIWRAWE